MNTQLMVSYLEESCASDTDYSESDPLSGNHGDKNYRLPRTNRAAAVLLILVSIINESMYQLFDLWDFI